MPRPVTVTESDVRDAFRTIIAQATKTKAVNWAVNYAREGLAMTEHELKTQCLYVLNNITHWRGELAKTTRETLRKFVAEN